MAVFPLKKYYQAKVGDKGRIHLPVGVMEKYQIKEGDILHIYADRIIEIRGKTNSNGEITQFQTST